MAELRATGASLRASARHFGCSAATIARVERDPSEQAIFQAMAPGDQDEDFIPDLEIKGGAEALKPYAGKVVAIVDGEIKASGGTWKEALRAADAAGLDDPLFKYVPDHPVMAGHRGELVR